jgi:hypothetical protein
MGRFACPYSSPTGLFSKACSEKVGSKDHAIGDVKSQAY